LGKEPNIEAINEALDYPKGIITPEHISLCEKIIASPQSTCCPRPHTPFVKSFSDLVSPEIARNNNQVSGCYLFASRYFHAEYKNSNTIYTYCYIGHSIHLGRRIIFHCKGQDSRTAPFLLNLGDLCTVFIYRVTSEVQKELGKLTLSQFLCVFASLEQYLFFKYKPKINKVLVSTHGIALSDEDLKNLQEKKGTPVYVYSKNLEGIMTLNYVFTSMRLASSLLGSSSSIVGRIIKVSG
jgi:hypothetical protein